MKKLLMALGVMAMSLTVAQAQYDDIYYNPKNDSDATRTTKQKKQKKSNYIADFSNMDVDAYNRAGDTYYATPVDTIGSRVGEDQDFVYTQQIQKYYNPTIVIDNADLLADVLNNSYGNVEVVINNNGIPMFSPYYSSVFYDYPFYSNRFWGPSWSWNWGPSWAWGPSWNWGWNWGPSWAWGPSWNWGWGPSWGWGPGWRPGPVWGGGWHRPFYADYRPGAHRPVAPRPGWSYDRPGGNYNGGHNVGRPGGNRAPSSGGMASGGTYSRQYSGNRRGYNDGSASAPGNIRNGNAAANRTYRTQGGHRQTTSGSTTTSTPNRRYSTQTQRATTSTQRATTSTFNQNRNNGNNRSYNSNRNNNSYNRNTYNSGSYNSSRSSGGSYGGGSRGGGGSRAGGGHRR